MSEIKNGRLGLYGAEHSECNHAVTLGIKGLIIDSSGRARSANSSADTTGRKLMASGRQCDFR